MSPPGCGDLAVTIPIRKKLSTRLRLERILASEDQLSRSTSRQEAAPPDGTACDGKTTETRRPGALSERVIVAP